ncbi:MEDS domain-containing protein [Alteribacter aurantiacus]|uniref:MEDS domain-containing protein n=1 Tax=Alteribacter aurantiacus TaxID=254410 RepID=UPI0004268847|nr:MEDS domain-containing protein [Alteribacter aurantiacus]
MHKLIPQSMKRMRQENGGHIFYKFEEKAAYLENAVTFICEAVRSGDDVAVIESEKILPQLKRKVESVLSAEQQEKVYYINNFQYYLLNGSFHVSSVEKGFHRLIEKYDGDVPPLRTWAHVEWGEDADLLEEVALFEQQADTMISAQKMISVCAYQNERICNTIEKRLQECHPFFMTDTNLSPSKLYKKTS